MRLIWNNCITYNQVVPLVQLKPRRDVTSSKSLIGTRRFSRISLPSFSIRVSVGLAPLYVGVHRMRWEEFPVVWYSNVHSSMKRKLIKEAVSLPIDQLSVFTQIVWEMCPDAITVGGVFLCEARRKMKSSKSMPTSCRRAPTIFCLPIYEISSP